MSQSNNTEWYASWFDSPYYHILYKDRDYKEAQSFMDSLTNYLNLPENGSILDLACGRGRHSIYLSTLGYRVTGVDLSESSIAYAKKFENDSLQFQKHDMTQAYPKKFDAVFNLFTSFGYFEDESYNLKTIQAISQELNETGFGVIDFMNVPKVLDGLIEEEVKTVENIDFMLKRRYDDEAIIKDISFETPKGSYSFTERVKALHLEDFKDMFDQAGVHLLDIFGDYQLGKYHKSNSERLIMIFK